MTFYKSIYVFVSSSQTIIQTLEHRPWADFESPSLITVLPKKSFNEMINNHS